MSTAFGNFELARCPVAEGTGSDDSDATRSRLISASRVSDESEASVCEPSSCERIVNGLVDDEQLAIATIGKRQSATRDSRFMCFMANSFQSDIKPRSTNLKEANEPPRRTGWVWLAISRHWIAPHSDWSCGATSLREDLLNLLWRFGRLHAGIKRFHHPHVFVIEVVTVEDERPLEGSKLHEELDFTARAQQ